MTAETRDFHADVWFTVDIVLPLARWLQIESLIRAEGGTATVLSVNPVPDDREDGPTLRMPEPACQTCGSPLEQTGHGEWSCTREGCR